MSVAVRTLTAAERACLYLASRLRHDGRLAWLIGPPSESWDMLTAAVADVTGCDVAAYRADLAALLQPVPFVTENEADAG